MTISTFATRLSGWLIALAATALTTAAQAKPIPNCGTPRNTVDSVFLWQLGEQQSLSRAATCFEKAGRTPSQLAQSARRLKAVYDAQGAYVRIDEISDDADYRDPDTQAARLTPHADLPEVYVEKRGDRWLWTAPSLDWIDAHYTESHRGIDRVVNALPPSLHGKLFNIAWWQYLALILLVLVGALVQRMLRAVVAKRLISLSQKLKRKWPAKVIDVIASPGATLVTAIVLRIGYPQLGLPLAVSAAMATTVRLLITVSVLWAIYRSIDVLSAWLAGRASRTESKLDDQLVPLLRKSLKVAVFVMGTLVILQNLHFNVTTLLTSVSIGTLAIGLAAKDTLANLFGSVSIFIDGPFQIGDWINVMGVDGSVEEVGFRSTRIRTFYNSVVVIPNARVADSKIDNFGQRQYRRCKVTLGLTYDTTPEQMQAFVEGCRGIIKNNSMTRKDNYEVHMVGFGDSALEVMLYFFFECNSWSDELRERHNIFLELMRLARALGVSFAFPTRSLHIESAPTHSDERAVPSLEALSHTVENYGPGGADARPDGPQITGHGYLARSPNSGVGDDA